MKAVAEETGKVGFGSEKAETLGEKSGMKKKVRVVKKIVKKKVIKKVPKRVPVASKCDDLEKVASPSPNVDSSMEIENPNFAVEELKEDENVKESVVSDMEDGVDLVKFKASDEDQTELQDGNLKDIELHVGDHDQIELQHGNHKQIELHVGQTELQDGNHKQIELHVCDDHQIELQDGNHKQIELHVGQTELQDNNHKQIELHVVDHEQIELKESNRNQSEVQEGDDDHIESQDGNQNQTELQEDDRDQIELQESDENSSKNQIDFENNDQDGIELMDTEHDANTVNVEEQEGEEGVKEPVLNNETDGLKSQEALTESKLPSEETGASRSHIKQVTKIFIHGLVEETKEEDIRKVFEGFGEIVEVKLITDPETGKNRGFGFISISAGLPKKALTNVEICGRPCHTAAIEGNYSLLFNNIDKEWKIENVVELLEKIGIKKIVGVLVLNDPANTELNWGFAFIEFETNRDAQIAYNKLQNKNVLGKHSNIEVSQALSFVDPVEEEIHNIKSVYAENIPLSWNEKEVEDHFKMFGEIESIALAKNLRTAKRNDFAFINYKTCEAAHWCIKDLTSKKSTTHTSPKGQLKVSLAKSMPKVKPVKTISDSVVTEASKVSQKANKPVRFQNQYQKKHNSKHNMSILGVRNPPQKPTIMNGKRGDSRRDLGASTTDELVQLLREQASWKHGRPSSTAGMSAGHHRPLSGGNQRLTELGSRSLYYHDPQAYHQTHLQIPNTTLPRPIGNMASYSRYDDQQQHAHYTSGSRSFNVVEPDPRYFQIRDQTAYPGSSSMYRRM